MQAKWLDVVDEARGTKPWLDVVLTHLDDRLEPGIRDALGADIARSLPFISARHATLLVEDPATLWDLGASRYAKMSQKYGELISNRQQIAVDINVVERYQDVYPTKKQTGTELFQLVHQAAASFPRVALYFENSLEKQDLELLPAAASTARISQPEPDELMIDGRATSRVQWNGNVEVDGQLWPIQAGNVVLLPSGKHRLTPGFSDPAVRLSDFNGEIRRAIAERGRVDLSYRSNTRAIARLATPASAIEVDGQPYGKAAPIGDFVMLPAGQHIVSFVP